MSFHGCKGFVFCGERLLVLLRDNTPDLIFADMWDLPGGGREGGETPEQTFLRETEEELGLVLRESDLVWAQRFEASHTLGAHVWYFAAHLGEDAWRQIVFGDEGQGWGLVSVEQFMSMGRVVPGMTGRLAVYLER